MEKKNGDSSAGGSVIAALCIIIYLFALVQGAVRLYLSIDKHKISAELEFNEIADTAQSAAMHGFMSDRYISIMNDALKSKKSLEALIITGAEGGHTIEKKTGYAIKWVNNEPRFINKISFSGQNLYKPLANLERNANIKAVASAVDFIEFINILKQTLMLIAVGLFISFITLITQLLTGKSETPKGEMVYVPTDNRTAKKKTTYRETEPVNVSNNTLPKGLYSSRSNIGWEEYTKDRLDSELHRCASTEKDLALILMEFSAITNDLMYMQAAEEAVNFFTSRDLLFEYGDQGITVILPGVGFDIAIARAEKFYQRIMEKYPNSFGSEASLNMGLSSRSGRLLNADRLILEANEALRKARSDTRTSIIAFKSDPEKYRAFIASQS